ncbi:MAG: hypothetical protein ACW986_19565, partial [Promethearchaeota archaeon]
MKQKEELALDIRVQKLKEIIRTISFFLTAATFIIMTFTLIAWIYSNKDLTPAIKFFYLISLLMNLYFPYL